MAESFGDVSTEGAGVRRNVGEVAVATIAAILMGDPPLRCGTDGRRTGR